MDFELVTSEARLGALKDEWEALWLDAVDATIFLSFDWVVMAWRRVGLRQPGSPRIALLRDAGKLVGAFPLMRRRRWGVLEEDWGLDLDMPQYHDALLRHGGDHTKIVDELLDGLWRVDRPHRLCLQRVPESSPLLRRLVERGAATKTLTISAGVDLSEGLESYVAGLDTFLKSDHRRRMRRLGETGEIVLRQSSASTIDADLDWLLLHKRQWTPPKERVLRAWVRKLESENDLRALLHSQLAAGLLWFAFLTVNDVRVAGSIFFAGPRGLLAYVLTQDHSFDRYSPGRSLNLRVIEAAASAGFPLIDFMGGDTEWKDRLANWHCVIKNVRYRQ